VEWRIREYPPFFVSYRSSGRRQYLVIEPTMSLVAVVLVVLVALLHLYFLVLEMFLWAKPAGRRAFGTTPEQAEQSKVLAANQGLYNGFLAAGLFWGLILGAAGRSVVVFFLVCVVVAGVFGAATASRKILWVQALPAAVALGTWTVVKW
jgi:putative membrane protein